MSALLLFSTISSGNKRGDFESLYSRYKNLMFKKAASVLGNPSAEAAVSEAFIRMYKNPYKTGGPASNLSASFVATVVKNTTFTSPQKYGEDDVSARDPSGKRYMVINRLSEELRGVFLLKYAYGLSHREVGGLLHISENDVTERLRMAGEKLGALLKDTGMETDGKELYHQISAEYAEDYGAHVNRELAELEREGVPFGAFDMDVRVQKGIRPKALSRARGLALIVACLLLALLAPIAVRRYGHTVPGEQPWNPTGVSEFEIASGMSENLNTLPFYLPPNFWIESASEAYGTRVYNLINSAEGEIVLTIWPATQAPPTFEILDEMEISRGRIHYESRPGYHLVIFEYDGILYVLNSRNSIDILIEVCEWISAARTP